MLLLNLDRKLAKVDLSAKKKTNSSKKWVKLLLLFLFLVVYIYLPARGIYQSSKQLVSAFKQINTALDHNSLDELKAAVTQSKKAVDGMNGALNWWFWLRFIPFLGGYYSDAKHFTNAASYELEAAEQIVVILEPHKLEVGLAGQPVPGQDKIAQATKILDKVIPQLDKIEPLAAKAQQEVKKIHTSKYPEKYGNRKLRIRIEEAKNLIIGIHLVVGEHRQALEYAPSALGQPNAKNYLLLFQNDKEIRPTGGFLTAFAFLKLDKGHLSTTASDDIYRLDEQLLKVCLNKICPLTPPAPIVKYLPEVTGKPRSAWSMRDSNLSPDLPTSAKEFERMYQLLGQGLPFDGIITIDTQVVEELIAITGPIKVFDVDYSAETEPRCNCPRVIYELEHYAEVASKGEADRKAVLGALMQQMMSQILNSGPEKMLEFMNVGVKLANDKHVMFYMHETNLQNSLSKLNWTGEIKKTNGDYLHINDANFAGGKSNLYVDERVTFEIDDNGSGISKHKLSIEYKNPQPFNVWLNGILRSYIRIYVPMGAKLINAKGSDDPVTAKDDKELNKTFFEAFVVVRPQNSRMFTLEYELPFKASGKNYPLLIQKQPGAKDHKYTVKINGRTKAEFPLTADQDLNLSL